MRISKAFPGGPIPPVRGKCPEGTKGVGTGGPKGRMRVGEHHRYCYADIQCLHSLISHGLRRASFPQGKPFGAYANTYYPANFDDTFYYPHLFKGTCKQI